MQTFLPYSHFTETAKCLDTKRLGKQRVEAYQILKVLFGIGKRNKNGKLAWENHPAVKMWQGYEFYLYIYGLTICDEWINRGYKDTVREKIKYILNNKETTKEIKFVDVIPPWLDNNDFHASHRSNLLRKNKEYYSQFNWIESDDLPYYWPVK